MRQMDSTLKFSLALLLLGSAFASSLDHDFERCERVVRRWASSSHEKNVRDDKRVLRDLLFFLHIPRTGGRTYFHCFLKKLYDSSEECPRSYDKLHFDPRCYADDRFLKDCAKDKSNCRLLVTHDDYSLMSKLPRERTSAVTILRNPIDRVFSSYEFSIEVAARFLVHPNLTSATQMARRIRIKTNVVSTLDIWPWKYLVPWMREDLFARRDARRLKGIDHMKSTDPYNMEDMVMPLHKYLTHPVAHEIIHNGATFQIAGLTNNSYLPESHEIRHCVQKYKSLGEHVLRVAKRRLDSMLYVGLTEDHRESANLFADVVGAQVISRVAASNVTSESAATKPELRISVSESESDTGENQNDTVVQKQTEIASLTKPEAKSENMTVEKLMGAYEGCISNLRKAQTRRRVNSLKKISPANFTKEARRRVSEQVIQKIRSLNNLDLELYEYAKEIFAKEHHHVSQKLVSTGGLESMLKDLDGMKPWKLYWLAMPVLVLFFFFLFVNARRRTSKVKI